VRTSLSAATVIARDEAGEIGHRSFLVGPSFEQPLGVFAEGAAALVEVAPADDVVVKVRPVGRSRGSRATDVVGPSAVSREQARGDRLQLCR
jgi:hypothetical protein